MSSSQFLSLPSFLEDQFLLQRMVPEDLPVCQAVPASGKEADTKTELRLIVHAVFTSFWDGPVSRSLRLPHEEVTVILPMKSTFLLFLVPEITVPAVSRLLPGIKSSLFLF